MSDEPLTYAGAGVDLDASEAATVALVDAVGDVDDDAFAGVLEFGDHLLALATDGVGTKLLVAKAVERYDTIGIDCIAMNVNDLVAMGITPVGFVDYLAVDDPDPSMAASIGNGLADGAREAGVTLLGGETAVLPEIVDGFDLAGACMGVGEPGHLLEGSATPGDVLIGVPSSGIHSNGLTLARKAISSEYEYTDPFPPNPDRTIADVLLVPTRLYTDLLPVIHEYPVRGAAHITGGGITNLRRLGDTGYVIDDPLPIPPIFELIESTGDVPLTEMYRTYNMGIGFVLVVPEPAAKSVLDATDGQRIGVVTTGDAIEIDGCRL